MNAAPELIAPDVIQVLIAQATASGLSINDYLRRLLGLEQEQSADTAASAAVAAAPPTDERLATLQRIAERQAKRPFTRSADTLTMLREARAGAMWKDESTE